MPDDTTPTGNELATLVRDLATLHMRGINPETLLGNKPAGIAIDTTDGPIREPGDDAPTWRDIYDAHELSAALDLHSARAFKRGDTQTSAELAFASQAIADLDAQITAERAESRKTTQRLLDTISELQFRSTHRVSGTDPGNGDTLYEPRGDEEGDER